ncbi:MAG: TusE/DsrC/DsvC family sulfur relay protein [Dehalococcoidia bacterium]|nr:TusE/DsrC/DsvC family sulfur relay protein [Dehalococcoidia bacterium]
MATISFKDKTYYVDEQSFLIDYNQWDEDFAVLMAPKLHIRHGLSEKHWNVIRFVRESFFRSATFPTVFQTAKANGLTYGELRDLFPTGYLRGVCLLAGINYKDRLVDYYGEPILAPTVEKAAMKQNVKTYLVDEYGFLMKASEWDEEYAIRKAEEMKMPGKLSDKHWQIIHFLREQYRRTGVVPTVYECCESNNIELEDMEKLFPDGYQRGAVKVSGLRVR